VVALSRRGPAPDETDRAMGLERRETDKEKPGILNHARRQGELWDEGDALPRGDELEERGEAGGAEDPKPAGVDRLAHRRRLVAEAGASSRRSSSPVSINSVRAGDRPALAEQVGGGERIEVA
jgi:hypothetical protein